MARTMSSAVLAPHMNARTSHPQYPPKTHVPDANVLWSVPWPSYEPVAHTADTVWANDRTKKPGGWADPDISGLGPDDWKKRKSFEGEFRFDAQNRPLNPRGRTGMANRGLLGKWGVNHAADPVVTRWHPTDKNRLQMVAIKRRDVEQWGIPGGIVDDDETVSTAVRREFEEEAGNISDPEERLKFKEMCDALFEKGEVVYRGYVDEARNTDHAWLETSVFHMHCPPEIAKMLKMEPGDDAVGAMWLDIGIENPNIYPPHQGWIGEVAKAMLKTP